MAEIGDISMHYVALGDSISFGHNSKLEITPFTKQVYAELSRESVVKFSLIARQGWTSDQLLRSVRTIPNGIWNEIDLVSLIVGGNDLINAFLNLFIGNPSRIKNVAKNLRENVRAIVDHVQRSKTTIMIGTLYNPFPKWPLLEEYICFLNEEIRSLVKDEQLYLVDIYLKYKNQEQYLIDGYRQGNILNIRPIGNPIHPNHAGHQLIAQECLKVFKRSGSKVLVNAMW